MDLRKKYTEYKAKTQAKQLGKLRSERIRTEAEAFRKSKIQEEKKRITKARETKNRGKKEKLEKIQKKLKTAARKAKAKQASKPRKTLVFQNPAGNLGGFDLIGGNNKESKKKKAIKWF